MTPPAVKWMLAAAAATIILGTAALMNAIAEYLAAPRSISSTAGLPVFRTDAGLVSYDPFAAPVELAVIGAGVLLLVATVFVAAAVWRPRP